ncbi:gliding motility-associated C-terminal domain-containing protein [Flavobacteriaceae bacterium MAR_2010_188]|nr:gliding motility-associated C-terminal domain-containing protein [Flavobacteriaceae bacterium MAR_2010_188]
MRSFLFLFLLIFPFIGEAQTIIMSDGRSSQCGGKFYDAGGPNNDYGNNVQLTYTICPDNPGQSLRVQFTQFNVEDGNDYLYVYDGPDASGNAVGGLTGNNLPSNITASPNNSSGCITFVFSADSTIELSGWEADISCVTGCQTINSQLDSASPAPNSDGNIQVCVGETISLQGSGVFENSGAGATYQWDLGDGRTINGQSASFSYDTPGAYLVNLDIRGPNTTTDPEGCKNTNRINQIIQVGSDPDFTGTEAAETAICLGNSTVINGVVEGVKVEGECTPPVSGTTFLPDGTGETYFTSITVDCFDSDQKLENVNQLTEICLNIEHAWADDLDITIISPDGKRAKLFVSRSFDSEVYLGSPNDQDRDNPCGQTGPGTGANYCFTMAATKLLKDASFVTAGCPANNSIAPGNYLPVDSFASLIGSPLNGEWTLSITDNLEQDDGYLFEFNMAFDPNIVPAELSFTPTIFSESWDADPTITSTSGTNITVTPTAVGQKCYTYRPVDSFGCEFTKEVCIDVYPQVTATEPTPYEICDVVSSTIETSMSAVDFDLRLKDSEILGGQNPSITKVEYYLTYNDAEQAMNPLPTIYTNTSSPQTIYARVENTANVNALCYEITELILIVNQIPGELLPEEERICVDLNGTETAIDPTLDTALSPMNYTFEWSLDGVVIPFQSNSSIIANQAGIYEVLVTDRLSGCTVTDTTNVVESSPPNLTASLVTDAFADNNIIEATATGLGDYEYSLNDGPFQPSGRFQRVPAGLNVITANDINGCGTASVTIRVLNYPRFFTPNNDGSNDTWNVKGILNQPTALITIFDRYGKLLKQIRPSGQGWDGTFNGTDLPSADYWFSIEFNEPGSGESKNFKAHFSLIR